MILMGRQEERLFQKRDRMTINDYSNPPLASSLAFRVLPSPSFGSHPAENPRREFHIHDKIYRSSIDSN